MTLTVLLPTAVPGMIIGVDWLILGRYTGIYNTRWVILGAYVCAFTALVLQSVRAPLTQTPLAVEAPREDRWRKGKLPEPLERARAHPEWSSLNSGARLEQGDRRAQLDILAATLDTLPVPEQSD